MKHKKLKKRRFRFYRGIAFNLYISLSVMVCIVAILIGVIFMYLYQRSYREAYSERLRSQGKLIAKTIRRINKKNLDEDYVDYLGYLEELFQAEGLDIWIVANPDAGSPLQEKYENINLKDVELTPEIQSCLESSFAGKIAEEYSYDKIYGADIVQVSVPIQKKDGDVIGSVLMIAMIYRQTMSINQGRYLISISIVIALLLSFATAFIFAKGLSKSFERLSKKVYCLEEEDYKQTHVYKPGSEMGQIEVALNELGERLLEAKKERENQEQLRLDFFANVSHELRTPITVMRGYTESLYDGVITDEKQIQNFYDRMLSECKGMERLVEDLFILSKMQNPDFRVECKPVSLVQVFEDLIRSARVISEEKNIKILLRHNEDACMMLGDYDRLRQMFLVILDNAIKFSEENTKIDIDIVAEEKLQVSIRDYGCGIREEELPYIFEKFYKSKLRQNRRGTGLGLMIAKQIALKHDGEISVESIEGKGTTFHFTFDKLENLENYE